MCNALSGMRVWLTTVLTLLVFLLVLFASAAPAAPPTKETIYLDHTFVAPILTDHCGFTVIGRIEGTFVVKTFVDKNGGFTKEIDSAHLFNSFSANGNTVTGRTSQQIKVTLLRNGTYTVAFSGPDTFITLPHAGVVFGNVGRLVLLYSADDDELLGVVLESGQIYDDIEEICAALAP
jgi:hypothetical protein